MTAYVNLAITVKQPWAWAIAYGGKTIENRSWRGTLAARQVRIAIHAGAESGEDWEAHADPRIQDAWATAARGTWERMHYGAIIATARVADCHPAHIDGIAQRGGPPGQVCCPPWGEPNQYHWLLTDILVLVEPVPCRGRLGLWHLPYSLAHRTQIAPLWRPPK